MKNKRLTIVQSALETISGFDQVFKVIKQNTVLQGKSLSTFNNYIRRIAIISLYFDKLPEEISDDELKDYLTELALLIMKHHNSAFYVLPDLIFISVHSVKRGISIPLRSYLKYDLR